MPAFASTAVSRGSMRSSPASLALNRSQSFAKLAILVTSLIGSLLSSALGAPLAASPFATLAAPLVDTQGTFEALGHHGGGREGPRTTVELVVDMLSIFGLVILGGIFAGLTLGLMGLDMVNLQVLSTSGTEKERHHALKVLKLLEKGRHWVLVVLLLGNVVVNESLPVFLSDFGGTTAILTSTVLIVIFGEIVPQSICARYGLAIGAHCAPLVHALMIVMAPIAWPTAKLLDWCLGEDHGTTYRKAELKTFVSLHQQVGTENLNEDEVTIIRAVLDLNDKTVSDVMTPIEDVFTLPADHILDEEGVTQLVQSGYSRVPVHEPGKPDAILGMLLVKKLIAYDPEDAMPVSWFPLTPLPEAHEDLTLLDVLNFFQLGRSHMVLVSKYPGEKRGGKGIVTLEDVIEELIGEEIVDETDVYVDIHNKVRVSRNPKPGQANLQPLIQGIIERRRKSVMKRGSIPNDGRQRGVDKVAIKRPTSPGSQPSSYASTSTNGHVVGGSLRGGAVGNTAGQWVSQQQQQGGVSVGNAMYRASSTDARGSRNVSRQNTFDLDASTQQGGVRNVIKEEPRKEREAVKADERDGREAAQAAAAAEEGEEEGERRPLLGGRKVNGNGDEARR